MCSVQHEITRVLCDVCNCNIHFYNFQFPRSVFHTGGISCHNYAIFSETRGDSRNSHQFIFVVSGVSVRPSLCSGYLYCGHPLIRISCLYCCCYIKFDMCVKSEPGQMTKMSYFWLADVTWAGVFIVPNMEVCWYPDCIQDTLWQCHGLLWHHYTTLQHTTPYKWLPAVQNQRRLYKRWKLCFESSGHTWNWHIAKIYLHSNVKYICNKTVCCMSIVSSLMLTSGLMG